MTLLDLLPYALKRAASTNGGEYAGPCPSCGGRDRFRVWPTPHEGRPRFWCRQCGAHGDAIDLVRLVHPEMSFQEARRVAGENAPLDCAPLPAAGRRELPVFGERLIESYARHPERYARWLAYRGLRPETVDEFRLGYGTLPGEQFRTPGLIVPVFDKQGRCRTLRCRAADTWLTAGGCTLYAPRGLGALVMVVENCANACLIAQAAPHVTPVALTTGAASWDERWPGWIARWQPALVIVAGDDDEAGQRMNERWKLALQIAGVPVTTETINESREMEWRER